MRNYLLGAVAIAAIATPAYAQDQGGYFGIEGGIMSPRDMDIDTLVTFDDPLIPDAVFDDGIDADFKMGYDVDAIAGYDFGMFRLEAELGYKRAKADDLEVDQSLIDLIEDETGEIITDDDVDIDGRVRVWSLMGNGLLDFGSDAFGAYVGGGFGRANVKAFGESDSAWAWQLIAGVRTAISDNIDAGLKYRYFRTGKLDFEDSLDFVGGTAFAGSNDRFSSHSLLASLIFNFGEAAPPPPPPPPPAPIEPVAPPPPATQTCPDGSVILATDMCPLPPPPPPPPPPAPERG